MHIRLGYDMRFNIPSPVAMVAMLHVHPSRVADLREPDEMQIDPSVAVETYLDDFGNKCARFLAPAGELKLQGSTLIEDSGEPDASDFSAQEIPADQLPHDVLKYLLNSRYCEVDRLSGVALDLFGGMTPGYGRVLEICRWVNSKVMFGYQFARPTKTALDVYTERLGVCRDYQHLAVTFCRGLNIPARYVTGYLGDIRIQLPPAPMDFSAWFEAYLGGRWWTFDARHVQPRVGRVLMAVGRDASDVAITTSFGAANLKYFSVVSDEVIESPSSIREQESNE
jgi:transglutaminase-like putative cysteine protease